MNAIQMSFYALKNLFGADSWFKLLTDLEQLLSENLSHLDTNDPIRKKVESLEEAADFICAIGDEEGSRRLFGKFGKSKVELRISLFKDVTALPNSMSLYFPEKIVNSDKGRQLLHGIFLKCNQHLFPFYSICDSVSTVAGKRKGSGFAVDLQAELIGIFWLTYFNRSYLKFFGQSKLDGLGCETTALQGGVEIKLGASPFSIDVSREDVEIALGKKAFVQPELPFDKPVGKNALTFKQIIEMTH